MQMLFLINQHAARKYYHLILIFLDAVMHDGILKFLHMHRTLHFICGDARMKYIFNVLHHLGSSLWKSFMGFHN